MLPCRLALLDPDFTASLGHYPEVMSALFCCATRRARRAATTLAIVHHPHVADRVQMLLWELAARWGVAESGGVHVPVRLTHELLAELTAARRRSVSTAISKLAASAEMIATKDGWLLTGKPPAELADTPRNDANRVWPARALRGRGLYGRRRRTAQRR